MGLSATGLEDLSKDPSAPRPTNGVYTAHVWATQVRLGRDLEKDKCQNRPGHGNWVLTVHGI